MSSSTINLIQIKALFNKSKRYKNNKNPYSQLDPNLCTKDSFNNENAEVSQISLAFKGNEKNLPKDNLFSHLIIFNTQHQSIYKRAENILPTETTNRQINHNQFHSLKST